MEVLGLFLLFMSLVHTFKGLRDFPALDRLLGCKTLISINVLSNGEKNPLQDMTSLASAVRVVPLADALHY